MALIVKLQVKYMDYWEKIIKWQKKSGKIREIRDFFKGNFGKNLGKIQIGKANLRIYR